MDTYELHVAGVTRYLPIIAISNEMSIASFVVLGDTELVSAAAPLLAAKLPEVDILVTAEAKGIPFVHELSKVIHNDRYVVARKSVKSYMDNPVIHKVQSITTAEEQTLCLDGADIPFIKDKKVAIVDDVISTGESIHALETLIEKAGGQVIAKAAILAEGDAAERDDIIYLEPLPIF